MTSFFDCTVLSLSKLDRAKQDEVLLKPFTYIRNNPSKYHKLLVRVFNYWIKTPEDKVREIENIVEDIHTASLIIDDLQDGSALRYGIPAAHRVFGIGLTLNAVSHSTVVACKRMLALHPSMINIAVLELIEDIHRGQGTELHWRDKFECPTEEEYMDMTKQKTGLFYLVIIWLRMFSDNKEDKNYMDIAVLIGLYYAIRDDYCNLFNRQGLKSLRVKQIKQEFNGDSDITDGKFSLPIIHALQFPEIADEVMEILKQRTTDWKVINHCISLLEAHGCDKYTEGVLRKLETEIEDENRCLGSNPELTSLMKELQNWRRGEMIENKS